MPDLEGDGPGTDHRRHPRLNVEENFRATITDANGDRTEAVVRDISVGGAGLIVGGAGLIVGGNFHNETFVDLHMEGVGKVNARVARQFAKGIGLEFNLNEKERAEMMEELIKFRKAGGRSKF